MTKKITELPNIVMLAGDDVFEVVDISNDPNGSSKITLQNLSDNIVSTITVVSQVEAEAGTSTDERIWTPERVRQAIEALPSKDDNPLVKGNVDGTKQARLDAETKISTGTVRVVTLPDADISLFKHNLTAAVAPTATDDSAAGYEVGSLWVDQVTTELYTCSDATATAAVWDNLTDGSNLPVVDTTSIVEGNVDDTKEMRIDVENNVATGTVRVLEMPNADVLLRKNNYGAAVAPAVSNDDTEDYEVGSIWFDTTADKAYVCLDSSTGAAVWLLATTDGGDVLPVDDTISLVQDPVDNTKQVRMDAGLIDTATTRILEMPNADVLLRKHNFAAAVAPTATDDSASDYAVGSVWIDTTADNSYICVDATATSAVWKQTDGGGGASLPVDDTTSIVQDPVDNTKQTRIDTGAVTTATTRTIFMQDADKTLHKDNLAAAVAPTTSNDDTEAYTVGSVWVDTTGDNSYICVDNSTGAAVWNQLNGSQLPVDDTTSLVQDPVDNTKQVRLDAGDVTTATTRTIFMKDADKILHKDNLAAAVAPTATDDSASGYSVGSIWIDTTADDSYICVDDTATSAVWNQTNSAGGGGATTALDNLASTAVNADINPDTDNTHDLGSPSLRYAEIHAATAGPDDGSSKAATTEYVDNAISTITGSGGATITTKKRLGQVTLTADSTSIDFSSLDQSYDRLIIKGRVRSDQAGTADNFLVEFNGDTTASNYHRQSNYGVNGAAGVSDVSDAGLGVIPGNTAPADSFGQINIVIENYAGSKRKVALSDFVLEAATNDLYAGQRGMIWENTSAINRVTLKPGSGTNLMADTKIEIFGEKEISVGSSAGGGGEWTLLSTQEASASADIEFDTSDETYEAFKVVFVEAKPSSNSVAFGVQVEINNLGSFETGNVYQYAYNIYDSGGGGATAQGSNTATTVRIANGVGNAATESLSGEWILYAPHDEGNTHKLFKYSTTGKDGIGDVMRLSGAGAYDGSLSNVTKMRILPSSGTISSGTFYHYGLSSSSSGGGGGSAGQQIVAKKKLSSVNLASSQATLSFNDIDQTYDRLIIKWHLRTDKAVTLDSALIQANSDSTATNYHLQESWASDGSAVSGENANRFGPFVTGTTSPLDGWSDGVCVIENYSGSEFKNFVHTLGAYHATDAVAGGVRTVTWKNTSAITDLSYIVNGGGNFIAGSYMEIYGEKEIFIPAGTNRETVTATKELERQTLTSTAGSITFSNIDQTYERIYVQVKGRTDSVSDSQSIKIEFNGDTTAANYHTQNNYADNGANSSSETASASWIGVVPAAGGVANSFATGTISIDNYTDGNVKNAVGHFRSTRASVSALFVGDRMVTWNNTSAITSLTITPSTADDFVSGSEFILYGEKKVTLGGGGDGGGGFTMVSIDDTDSPYAASAGEYIKIDTTGGTVEVDLPTPTDGDQPIMLVDGSTGAGNWATNNVTVDFNGSTVDGDAGPDTLNVDGSWIEYTSIAATEYRSRT